MLAGRTWALVAGLCFIYEREPARLPHRHKAVVELFAIRGGVVRLSLYQWKMAGEYETV